MFIVAKKPKSQKFPGNSFWKFLFPGNLQINILRIVYKQVTNKLSITCNLIMSELTAILNDKCYYL